MLTISDFTVQPRGPRTSDVWSHTKGFDTSMGKFDVECIVDVSVTPSVEMLAQLGPVLAFVLERNSEVLCAVHDHYRLACEDVEWMQELEVPMGLNLEQIVPLLSGRSVTVHLDENDDPESDFRRAYIHIIPAWDEEHHLFLKLRDGAVERLER